MLPATRSAASWRESRARWAYRAVVSMSLWPSSLPIIGRYSPSDISLLADLLRLLYRSDGFAVAESPPCRKSPAMLAATRAAEALTVSRARCA